MAYSPIALSRRHVLGDYYSRCDAIESVPVYLDGTDGELLGQVDESMGKYADAFLFHLSEDLCKKLSAGHFTCSFDFEKVEETDGPVRRRIKLNSITLIPRKAYAKPLPKRSDGHAAEVAAIAAAEVASLKS
jgi:hypothetical protein